MASIYEMLSMNLASLTDKNEHLCSSYMAAIKAVLKRCHATGRNVEGVHFSIPRVTDETIRIDVFYD